MKSIPGLIVSPGADRALRGLYSGLLVKGLGFVPAQCETTVSVNISYISQEERNQRVLVPTCIFQGDFFFLSCELSWKVKMTMKKQNIKINRTFDILIFFS